MFDGRHCTKRDLDLLVKETNKIKLSIAKNSENSGKNKDLQRFFLFLSRFDTSIAEELEQQINASNDNYKSIIKAIDIKVDELKQNVIVDIYEHQ